MQMNQEYIYLSHYQEKFGEIQKEENENAKEAHATWEGMGE